MEKKTVLRWEVWGFFVIVTLGSLLHFCFEWSGGLAPLALFCAVNESVWEHLKLGFWPGFFFYLLEYLLWGRKYKNFLAAKTVSLYTMPIVTVVVFYLYTSIIGKHILAADIAIFVASVLLAQLIGYKTIVSENNYSIFNKYALVMLAAITLAFSLLTYFPPKLQLFIDPNTGRPGISIR